MWCRVLNGTFYETVRLFDIVRSIIDIPICIIYYITFMCYTGPSYISVNFRVTIVTVSWVLDCFLSFWCRLCAIIII